MKSYCWVIALLLFGVVTAHASEPELSIGMLLWRGETAAETGFKDRLSSLGYQVDYVVLNSDQNLKNLGNHLHSIKNSIDSFDYIYTFGTTVSRRAKVVISGKIPQLFNIVTDPVAAGIADSYAHPGNNISGASDFIKVSRQLGIIEKLFTFKKLGFFFNPREKNSMIFREELLKVAEEKGFSVVDFRTPPVQSALAENLQKLTDNPNLVDAVLLAADSYLSSESEFTGAQLRKAKIKSIGSVRDHIENGVLIGVVADYYQLGSAVADIVDRHQRGDELGMIPVEQVEQVTVVMNRSTADMLGVDIEMLNGEEIVVFE